MAQPRPSPPPRGLGAEADVGAGVDLGEPRRDRLEDGPPLVPGKVPDRPDRPRPRTASILEHHPVEGDGPIIHLNRELSWLQFDERVLTLAEDPTLPLLERARLLSIFAGNLDEFSQVRISGLKEQVAAGVTGSGADGMTPSEQLRVIGDVVADLTTRASQLFRDVLAPELGAQGIRFSDWSMLDDDDRAHLVEVFEEQIFPVLTPLAVDPAHPFPYLSNLSLNLAVVVRDPEDGGRRFARIKVPPLLSRFIVLPDGERFVPLEQVIAAHLDRLFPGLEIVEHHVFRVMRNADFEIEEDEADDLLLAIETELTRRRFGRLVRLEIEPEMSDSVLDLLRRELRLADDEILTLPGPLDLSGLATLVDLDRPDLKFPPVASVTQPRLTARDPGESSDLFAALRDGDILVQHPYDSFTTSVQAFLETAAHDPQVLAIKITLYRTSGPSSPISRALLDAAAEGKQVVALIELKARFDEETNIEWARVLEEAGVHVVYGVVGLKTHTKVCLVVRDDGDRVRRYAHIGTGNYNDRTARSYEDLGLLSADPDVGADLSDLFNVLTGYSRHADYRRLVVAPSGFRSRMLDLIERERDADDGQIVAKMNSLVDARIIEALYEASSAGTSIDLIVRGVCCLRPGVPGVSDNIRVRSIVGRYLEHSRIYRFGSDARGHDYLIGSGDWMPRNLDRRVEALVPISDPGLCDRLDEILDLCLDDDLLAWDLRPDTRWERVEPEVGIELQQTLRERARRRAR